DAIRYTRLPQAERRVIKSVDRRIERAAGASWFIIGTHQHRHDLLGVVYLLLRVLVRLRKGVADHGALMAALIKELPLAADKQPPNGPLPAEIEAEMTPVAIDPHCDVLRKPTGDKTNHAPHERRTPGEHVTVPLVDQKRPDIGRIEPHLPRPRQPSSYTRHR